VRLKPAESRIAAIALLLVVLALAYFVLVHWWFVAPQAAIDDEMNDLRDTHGRFAAAIAERPALEKHLAELSQGQTDSSAFLAGDDANAASAGLMQRVVTVAESHRDNGPCDVVQKMPVPGQAKPGEPYTKVTVNISLRCGMEPLAAVLHDLEQGVPYLFVDDFSAYRNPVAARTGNAAPLETQFTLSGYIRRANAAPATGGKP
jgi:general secretion pathway protein M